MFSYDQLTDTAGARSKLHIIYVAQLPAITYADHFFLTKFTKLHRHSSFTLSYSLCFFIVSVHLSLRGSAAGMRLGIYLADPVMIHIGIDLRCGNIRMSQHFLYTF